MAKRERTGARSSARPDRGSRRKRSEKGLDETYLEAMSEVAGKDQDADGEHAGGTAAESETSGKHFGSMGTARVVVEISDDGREAILTELSFGGDPALTGADLLKAVDDLYAVKAGIEHERIEQLAERAAKNPAGSLKGRFPIARGSAPVPGDDGRVELTFLDDATGEQMQASFASLSKALEQEELEATLHPDLLTYLAVPGEVLAIVEPGSPGTPGKDVFGNEILPVSEEAGVRAGSQVGKSESNLVAESYGYASLVDNQLSVISPIWISPDKLEAHFVHFPHAGEPRRPQSEWLMQLLARRDVTHGIEETSIEKLCNDDIDPQEKTALLLARGKAATHGVDAHVEYAFDHEKRAGTILEDGSVDLRERNAAISVEADQLLGEFVAATSGQAGMNLLGEELEATDGEDRTFTAGDNVREESDSEGVAKFYSEIDGNVYIDGDVIQVNEVFVVNGDVNYDVGNIDVRTDVDINGSVCSGFSVKAGGTVTINGMVESGATVNSQADILVSQGIVGETTKIVAFGNITTKYIQNCAVLARGNIEVGSYIFSGHVRAGAEVTIQSGGGDRGGSIVGGEVIATGGITAKFIGSPSTDRTVVGIGPNPEDAARLSKLKAAIDFCDAHIVRLMRTVGLTKMDSSLLVQAIQKASPSRKEFLVEATKKLKELADSKGTSQKSIDEIQSKVAAELSKAQIKVSDKVFSDVHVQIGDSKVSVSEDLAQPIFHLTEQGIRFRPQTG